MTLVNGKTMAEKIGITPKTLIQWRELGLIPFVDMGGQPWYIPDEVFRSIKKRQKFNRITTRGQNAKLR